MKPICVVVLVILMFSAWSHAEVLESVPHGFTVSNTVTVTADPQKTYDAILQVDRWWHPDHTWFDNVQNLSIEPEAGGCFCERNGKQGARHMTVVYADPGKLLRLNGALGPLQDSGLTGALTFRIAPAKSGSELELKYIVGGFVSGGCENLAPIVDSVLAMQLGRLKNFIDTGKPESK